MPACKHVARISKVKYVVRLLWGFVAAGALAGCGLSQPNFFWFEASFYQSEARLRTLYNTHTLPHAVVRAEFPPVPALAVIEQTAPTNGGGQLLRDEVITDSTVEATLQTGGLPDAVEINRSFAPIERRWFAMYYANPPLTFVYQTLMRDFDASAIRYHSSEVFRMNAVPRSVYRIALGAGPMAPPWPVTIPPSAYEALGVPTLGAPPPSQVDGRDWAPLAKSLAGEMREGRADYAIRTYKALRRLELANPVPGLEWKAVLFDSSVVSGFGVPDGTLFISTNLVEKLNDDQLAAALAHLMGHERYQHYPHNLRVGEQLELAGPARFFNAVPKYPDVLTTPEYGFSRWEEVDANRIAVEYLARIDIPPDILFDALHKLSPESGEASAGEWPSFAQIHHLPETAADLGRMLDAGIFRSPDHIAESSR